MIPETTGPAAVIVLAAGAGTRMKSRTPKILHEIGGRSMVGHALLAARSINPRQLALVVRHERDLVAEHLADWTPTPSSWTRTRSPAPAAPSKSRSRPWTHARSWPAPSSSPTAMFRC